MHSSLYSAPSSSFVMFFIDKTENLFFYEIPLDLGVPLKKYEVTESGCGCLIKKVQGECPHEKVYNKRITKLLVNAKTGKTQDVDIPFQPGWAGLFTDELILLPPPADGPVSFFESLVKGEIKKDPGGSFQDVFHLCRQSFLYEVKISDEKNKINEKNDTSDIRIPVPDWEIVAEPLPESAGIRKEIPKPDDFYVDDDVWEALLWAGDTGNNVCITGPSGSGKTEIVYHVADALQRDIQPFCFGAMNEPRISLIGATHFDKEKGTWFVRSRFVNAFEKGETIILLDEITRCERDAYNILFSAMDGQGMLYLDEDPDTPVILRGERTSFMATANVGAEYTGTGEMDRALKDRFPVKIEMDFPPPAEEHKILTLAGANTGKNFISRLIDIAGIQRQMARDDEFVELISTRMLLDCVRMVQDGVNRKAAVTFALLGCFSSEGGEGSDRHRCMLLFQRKNLV